MELSQWLRQICRHLRHMLRLATLLRMIPVQRAQDCKSSQQARLLSRRFGAILMQPGFDGFLASGASFLVMSRHGAANVSEWDIQSVCVSPFSMTMRFVLLAFQQPSTNLCCCRPKHSDSAGESRAIEYEKCRSNGGFRLMELRKPRAP